MELTDSDFRSIADHAPVMIWVCNLDLECVYVNHRWCEFSGQTQADALGSGWGEVLHPDDKAKVFAARDKGFRSRESISVECQMLRHDGEYRWMISDASPRYSADGEFQGFIGSSVEIHNERLLREQAVNQHDRLEEFYEKTPVKMHSLNAEGTIVSVSDDWLTHFGYLREEVIGRQRTDFMSPSSKKVAEARLQKFMEDGYCENLNYQILTKSGEIREVMLSAIAENDINGNFQKSIAILEDVTDSKKSMRRLEQTQKIFDQSGESIFWLTTKGKIIYVNEQACRGLEYSSEELLEKSIWEIDPNYTKELWDQIDWRGRLEKSRILQSIHRTRSGRDIPVEINSKLIEIDEETVMCAFVRDLTDRIQTGQELKLAQRRLEETLRSGNIGLWDWDMKTDEVLYSPEWKTQVGLSPDANVEGYTDWENRLHPDDKELAVENINAYLQNRSTDYISVFRFRHENGSYRWIRAQGRVFKDQDDNPERMIGVHIDITDHQDALHDLAERSAELEAIFQASPDIFLRTDKVGVIKDYRVSDESSLMTPPDRFMNQPISSTLPDRVGEIYERALTNLAQTNQSQTIEYRIRIQGEHFWHQAVLVPFQETNVAIFVRNITEQKSSEIDLISRTHELERSNADLDQFAYVASHDLKTPLRGIQHLTKWIREDSEGKLPEECLVHLDKLDTQVARMHSLLDDLLQYSRAGRVRVAVEPIDLQEMLEEIVGLVNPPQEMQIHFELNGIEIVTGRAPLFHVILNLVENAVKYHDRQDGQIHIQVSETSDIEYVQFQVRDDGPGIEKEHHDRVFRMFQRLDSKQTGSGMGLAVVRKMIESRGGSIQMVSQPGQGTSFHFTWPGMSDLPEDFIEEDE
ncbi:MAG: PAS domain S-box protein [Planctomicrobium sp.]|nr:PAS domain S-box protein [Planctomicrobium sp.]